jgi:sensor histidine kinase YesM
VTITARMETNDREGFPTLSVIVQDSGDGVSDEALRQGREMGVGLKNVERRLACQYGAAATVAVRSAIGSGTTVEIRMPAELRIAELASSRSAS